MNWIYIALIGPVLYAITNHIDKYILEKYFKGGDGGALILFSSLFSIFALPVVFFIEPTVFSLKLISILILIFNGTIDVICLILYFKALQTDEASTVVPYYQTIPVFGFVLGYFILGETLGLKQILACTLIIVGTIILSLDFDLGKIKVKKKVAALMMTVALLSAIGGVIFKMVAVEEGFWHSAFWAFAGSAMLGTVLFFSIKTYRKDFLWVLQNNSFSVILLNSLNEILYIIAEGVLGYASLLAPIALVMTINSFQPVFVFLFGIIMTIFFPKLVNESLSKNEIARKILAIGVITIGAYVLGISGAL